MTGRTCVAISTTGDEHRLPLLLESVAHWDLAMDTGDGLCVTVDGDEAAWQRVYKHVSYYTASVWRVGQPTEGWSNPLGIRDGRLGVAANKNTGLEAMMAPGYYEHLWLSDDDTWPVSRNSLELHHAMPYPHSMVCWGRHRRSRVGRNHMSWTWPRGAALYVTSAVVDRVGGMVEAFGPGGHEHVEWSRRIHQAGFTPCDYPSPLEYGRDLFMGARKFWHAEDMGRVGESVSTLMARRRALTTVRRKPDDPAYQTHLMAERDGDTSFVPYEATDNRRWSATLSPIVGA